MKNYIWIVEYQDDDGSWRPVLRFAYASRADARWDIKIWQESEDNTVKYRVVKYIPDMEAR
jgi:hypothetical protein